MTERIPVSANLELRPEAGGPPIRDVLLLRPLAVGVVGPGGCAAVLVRARRVACPESGSSGSDRVMTHVSRRLARDVKYKSVFSDSVLLG